MVIQEALTEKGACLDDWVSQMGGEGGVGSCSERESLSTDHKSWRASGVPKGLRECLVVAEGGGGGGGCWG